MTKKTALVTGSTAGIGRSIALKLVDNGFSVIITGRRDKNEVLPLINDIKKRVNRENACIYVRGDLADIGTREEIINCVNKDFGFLSLIVNNAGITTVGRKDILDIQEEDMAYLMKVNLLAPFMLTKTLVPYLEKSSDRSYVINISSISSYAVSTNRADYCISKAGMSMMTQQFAVRLADKNIGVFEIRPGIIRTDMTSGVRDKYDTLIDDGLLPIRRWGEPEDIARAVEAIVNGYLPYSTGEVINVDGGFHIRRL